MADETSQPVPTATATPKLPLWLRLLGIKRRSGKRIPFGLSRWGLVLATFIVLVGASAGFAEYSMQPDFCRSCHLMEPYYQAWHSSTHKDVACTKCHFEPGLEKTLYGKFQASSQAVKYLTKTYGSKPHAEVRDSSCMREGCHERRLLEGKVNWTVKSINGNDVTIRFDHKPHLTEERRGKQLRCVSCHSQIVQGQHLVVTLDTCFLCHFKGLEHGRTEQTIGGCKACHDAPKQEIRLTTGVFNHADYLNRGVTCENCHSDVIKGDGAVPKQTCWNCHNQPQQVARMPETNFIHDAHVSQHKVECSSCHIQIEHHLSAGAQLSDAHLSKDASTCGQCHEQSHVGPAVLFRGTGGRGVADMPSPMFRAQVDCIACHKVRKQSSADAQVVGQTFLAVQESCNYCHGNKYEGVLDVWKKAIAQESERADAAYLAAKMAYSSAKLTPADDLKVQRLLDDADHNIRLVKLGHGVHNVNYSTAVLHVALDRCAEAQKVIEQSKTESARGGS
jgi:nitrate/TMAO reductase-like tetraheme cytochrome c subunit